MLRDRFGRHITYLRISVTDRCNFRCQYCMPEVGVAFRPRSEILTFEEVTRLARIFHLLGVTKFRFTGGEPLVRKELPKLISMVRGVGDVDLHMTTNGYFLPSMAGDLHQAGISGLNISLDSLRPERVFQISRRHYFPQVWKGIETALSTGFDSIKINAVLIRGINDDEIYDFAQWTEKTPVHIRFIEYMPYRDNAWSADRVVHGHEVAMRLAQRFPEAEWLQGRETDGVSTVVKIPGFLGTVGFIDPMSNKFCNTCNRVRLTAEGQLRLCLFSESGIDLREPLRNGATDEEIADRIQDAIFKEKPEQNPLPNAEWVKVDRYMVEVGG